MKQRARRASRYAFHERDSSDSSSDSESQPEKNRESDEDYNVDEEGEEADASGAEQAESADITTESSSGVVSTRPNKRPRMMDIRTRQRNAWTNNGAHILRPAATKIEKKEEEEEEEEETETTKPGATTTTTTITTRHNPVRSSVITATVNATVSTLRSQIGVMETNITELQKELRRMTTQCKTTPEGGKSLEKGEKTLAEKTRAVARRFEYPVAGIAKDIEGLQSMFGIPAIIDEITRTLILPVSYQLNFGSLGSPLPFAAMQPIKLGLFSGPPGMGKSRTVQCVVKEIEKRMKAEDPGINIKLYKLGRHNLRPEYVGVASNDITGLLDLATNPDDPSVRVVIVWIDEIDIMFPDSSKVTGSETFYTELTRAWADLLTTPRARRDVVTIVIGTTNCPDSIDPSILSRVSYHYRYPETQTEAMGRCVLEGLVCTAVRQCRPDYDDARIRAHLPPVDVTLACARRYTHDIRKLVQCLERTFNAYQSRMTPAEHKQLLIKYEYKYPEESFPTVYDYCTEFGVPLPSQSHTVFHEL